MGNLSKDVVECMVILDEKREKLSKKGIGGYHMDRVELAMDYLLNDPLKEGDPEKIVNCLLGSSGKQLRKRINQTQKWAEEAGVDSLINQGQQTDDEVERSKVHFIDELRRSRLKPRDKEIIYDLMHDEPHSWSCVQVCRARKRFNEWSEVAV